MIDLHVTGEDIADVKRQLVGLAYCPNDVAGATGAPVESVSLEPMPEDKPMTKTAEKPTRSRRKAAQPANGAPAVDDVPPVPAEAPVAPSEPVPTPIPAPAPEPAPVSAPAPETAPPEPPSIEAIATAGAALLDADGSKMTLLMALLSQYGVPAITHLTPEQRGPFAADLRAMGAKI